MAEYTHLGSKLVVVGKLDQEEGNDFYAMCQELIEREGDTLTVDLSEVSYIGSMATGVLASLWLDAKDEERTLKIISSPQVNRVLRLAGLGTAMDAGERD